MADLSYLVNADPAVLDDYYRQYLKSPEALDESWQKFFEGFELARSQNGSALSHAPAQAPAQIQKEMKVLNLIAAYRQRGHLFTKTNPVRARRNYEGKLTLQNFDLTEADLDTVFESGHEIGIGPAPLRDIIRALDETYCYSIGVEYKYIRDPKTTEWLESRMESSHNRKNYSREEKIHLLKMLTQSVMLEKFMHQRFVGQKRFSGEGVESFIPAMDALVERGADSGVREFIFGMAHRGRFSLITNVLGKEYHHVFHSFEGKSYAEEMYAGDVKYHLGHSGNKTTRNGKIVHLSLMPNPSHLEAIDPVVVGLSRAKLDQRYSNDENAVIPILIHGDSSIAGQGIVYELLQMSAVKGFRAGGTLHIVLNNQVGFTTNYIDARSSTYCTDVGKVTLSPVFHVNADDVEAVVYVVELALAFRQQFHRDVFIDLLGYRKHGHNEGDEPRFTQPLLYKAIAAHPNPMEIYRKKLIEEGVIDEAAAKQIEKEFLKLLDEEYEKSKETQISPVPPFLSDHWAGLRFANKDDFRQSPETGLAVPELKKIAVRINTLPSDKKFFTKAEKIFADRRAMMDNDALDWGMAELLAYATLCEEGHRVRISGEDVERGTFSHRHAMVRVEDSEEEYFPLQHISDKQAPFEIYNSILSEYGVMGFEYGYAMATANGLVVWEAQFGDFANGAQIVIDQFVASGEAKWRRRNGLVLLLPHGPEGLGPEHSSARLERYLELCADTSMQVVQPTTPANFFHVLRRQLKRPFRLPLVVLTPKSLLRHPRVISKLKEMGPGTRFQEVLDDTTASPKSVKRVILTAGKIYYDLLARKEEDKRKDTAIVRLEQFYPIPIVQLESIRHKYSSAEQWIWVQEEPLNMGAWPFLLRKFQVVPLQVVSRKESCTPASGFMQQHEAEQKELVELAFA